MCGIAGIYAYRNDAPNVDREELRRLRDPMAARGPDGQGEWFSEDSRVALGHRRLAIIDLSERGAQPMVSADGQLIIGFNGEIYNYRALRAPLEHKGYVFCSHSDTEVLFYLYQEHGLAMTQYLRGMYAFALWDRCKQGLLLARDPFGIKPLYYADDGTTIRVASQVKALLKGAYIDTTPEPAGHVGFYLWGHVPEPYTLYKGIRALPAGSALWVGATGLHAPRRFFSLTDELARASETTLTPRQEERQERLRAELITTLTHKRIHTYTHSRHVRHRSHLRLSLYRPQGRPGRAAPPPRPHGSAWTRWGRIMVLRSPPLRPGPPAACHPRSERGRPNPWP